MVTNFSLFFWQPHHKIKIWSQTPLFLAKYLAISIFGHLFLSIFENPKILCSKIFGKKNKLGKGLKERENKPALSILIIYIIFQFKEKIENKNNILNAITIIR